MIPLVPLVLLASFAFVFFVFLVYQVWWRYSQRDESPVLTGGVQLIPVDLEAFENLTDPDEEDFLRVNLLPAEFRGVQRDRLRAAKMYVSALSENASLLVAIGQSARHNPAPEIAAAGLEIVQKAIRLKVWCLISLLRLNAALAFPTVVSPSNRVASQYQLVSCMAANLPRRLVA